MVDFLVDFWLVCSSNKDHTSTSSSVDFTMTASELSIWSGDWEKNPVELLVADWFLLKFSSSVTFFSETKMV